MIYTVKLADTLEVKTQLWGFPLSKIYFPLLRDADHREFCLQFLRGLMSKVPEAAHGFCVCSAGLLDLYMYV